MKSVLSVEGGQLMCENGGGGDQHHQGVRQGIRAPRDSMQCVVAGFDRHHIRFGTGEKRIYSEYLAAAAPMEQVAEPIELAGAVLYLASDACGYTTGISLNGDRGVLYLFAPLTHRKKQSARARRAAFFMLPLLLAMICTSVLAK